MIEDVEVGRLTRGHRFYGNAPFEVAGAADYAKALKSHKVILDSGERAELIAEQARALAREHKLALVEDEVLNENAVYRRRSSWSFHEGFSRRPRRVPDAVHGSSTRSASRSGTWRTSGKLANRFLLERTGRQGRAGRPSSPATRR